MKNMREHKMKRIVLVQAMRTMLAVALVAIATAPTLSHADDAGSVTWARDVATIVYSKCAECHRPGQLGPMSLMSYAEARPWAKAIRNAVMSGQMPPWSVDQSERKFKYDLSLSDEQKSILDRWAAQGAPEGDASQAPPAPVYTEGWRRGKPDLIIELPEVKLPAGGPDQFPNLEAEVEVPEGTWLEALEVAPGDPRVLHHLILYRSALGGMVAGAAGGDALGTWAVGSPPHQWREGMGKPLPTKFKVVSNMHYHPIDEATSDKTRLGLYFGKGELKKIVGGAVAADLDVRIPPNAKDYILEANCTLVEDVDVISFFPHMHMRGRRMVFTAHHPDGKTETLINVPNYDFDWQWFYHPVDPVRLPAGTRINVRGEYDNSDANPNNPAPDKWVYFGEESDDDMMFGMFEFVSVENKKPSGPNMKKMLDAKRAELPADEIYNVSFKNGAMTIPMQLILHLPEEGKGMIYFPFGFAMLNMPLGEVKWDGGNFETFLDIFGGRGTADMKGTIAADGAVSGSINMKDVTEFGGLPFTVDGFEGKKVEG